MEKGVRFTESAAKRIKRAVLAHEGMVQPRPMSQRRRPKIAGGAVAVDFVAITANVAPATWNATTAESQSVKFDAAIFHEKAGVAGKTTIVKDNTIEVESELPVSVIVTAGHFKKATVIGGYLISVACTEWTLPPTWND